MVKCNTAGITLHGSKATTIYRKLKVYYGLKVFMDARSTVTAKEGDRYPLRPPSFESVSK